MLLLVGVSCRADPVVTFYQLSGASCPLIATATARLLRVPLDRIAVEGLAPDAQEGSVVAFGAVAGGSSESMAWRFGPERDWAADIALPRERESRVTAAADTGRGVMLGTVIGLLRVGRRDTEWLDQFVGVHMGTTVRPWPTLVREAVAALAMDGEGNLWSTGSRRRSCGFWGFSGFTVFATDPARWVTEPEGSGRVYPRLLRWRGPFGPIVGDPREAAVWAYGTRGEGPPVLVHVDVSMASSVPDADPPSTVPQGEVTPALAHACLAADAEARVWLAGDTLDGSRVHRFDGQTFADVTPPPDLLRGRRFTQLMAGADGRLYASTDGVGVLVLDDGTWGPHPINDSLPTLEGTELKPVSCMTLDSDGNLWVGMDNNIICWRPDGPQ